MRYDTPHTDKQVKEIYKSRSETIADIYNTIKDWCHLDDEETIKIEDLKEALVLYKRWLDRQQRK